MEFRIMSSRTKSHKSQTPQIINENPIFMPELINISGNETHLVLKFGFKKHEKSYVIHSSIALTFEQAEQFIRQIEDALESIDTQKK